MRVVALVPGGIGDQILFFPTLDDLKRSYPEAQLDVVVEPRSKAAYRVSQSVNDLLTFDYQDRNSLADWSNFVGTIRDREYDAVITVRESWLMGLVLWLTGIPTRVGYNGQGSGFLTNSVPYPSKQYLAAEYHKLLQPFGINTPCPELAVNILKSDIEWSQNEQKRLGVNETGYILINAGSSQISPTAVDQVYPVNNWQEIIQECQQKQPDLPVVLIQQSENQQVGRSLFQRVPGIKVTSPDNIGKLAAMIGGASLMLSTDDALLQLSVAVQTYTIALFGSRDPGRLLPKSDKFLAIKSPTDQIADISPQMVLEKIWGG
ncbi:glycosyltransferase family 9 protein [Nodularia harveyana UHCC-0300]|uniref:Glycosyltransferase family 9 protein n=1 Tax=Nodularia harveyana UHCC-0300 TaxID=2974287 RepID=A0ABU5UFA2_9CYAN|nr:glycosyltransferase family 9 protein [Nodularia harveyana]MEA5581988.1 glycosyltransferase family 9 protein [Nodularia harveyana UHCC-0300]